MGGAGSVKSAAIGLAQFAHFFERERRRVDDS